MATKNYHTQPQPKWPFAAKPQPLINDASRAPIPSYPDNFGAIRHPMMQQPTPLLEAFWRSRRVIYGLNHTIYYN